MGASEGECVSPPVTYEQLMEMERRLDEAVKALTRPTNFMIGTTAGAMLANFISGLLLIWFVNGACYLAKLAKARFLIRSYTFLHNKMRKQKNGESTDVDDDVSGSTADVDEAAAAFVAVSICESSNTLDIERQNAELLRRKKVCSSLEGQELKIMKVQGAAPCDKCAPCDKAFCEEASTSNGYCPDPSADANLMRISSPEANVSVEIGLLMCSTTLTVVDEQAQDLQRQALHILPPKTQLHPLEPGSVFLSATVSVATSAMDNLLHCAKRLLEKGRQLDPQCTLQLGATALLYTTSGENVELVLLEEGVHDVPIITSAQKFGKKTILIKGFYLKNTEIKASTSFEKSVCLNLVFYQKLANGVDLLLAQLPQGELLGCKSFVYVNKTIFVDNCTHPLVLRSKGKEVDSFKHKPTIFGTLCKRKFWICLVILYIYQVVAFQPWKKLFVGLIFQLIISFFTCFVVEYMTIPWKYNIFTQWLEFMIRLTNLDNILVLEESSMRRIVEMERSKNSMSNLTISKPKMVITKNTKRITKTTKRITKNTKREIENSDEESAVESSDKESDDDSKDETALNDENWEWRCYDRFFRNGRWVRKRAGKKAGNSVGGRPFDVITTVKRDVDDSLIVELIVHSPHLVHILRDCQPNTGAAFSEGSKIDANEIFFRRDALQAYFDKNYDTMLSGHDLQLSSSVWHVRHMLRFVERHFAETLVQYKRMQAEGCVSFDMLWAFFVPGHEVCRRCRVTNQECFATVKSPAIIKIDNSQAGRHRICKVALNVMDFNVDSYYKCTQNYEIPAFEGEVPFTSLQVCPLHFFPNHKDMEARFVSQGNIFYEVAMRQPFRFMEFKGSLNFYDYVEKFRFNPAKPRLRKSNADGRVMIDLLSFARMNPDYPQFGNAEPPCEVMVGMWAREPGPMKKPTDEELKLAPAFAYGFSFRLKKWGCFEVLGLRDIIFNQGAFDALQFRKDSQKEILWNVVQQYAMNGEYGSTRVQNNLDPIAHKGTGCIVLCHGPPGTGKTLTAEALAEKLQCPLWSISTFELNKLTDSVEKSLSMIMETAHSWHAILLVDEADVFLEKRDVGMRNFLTSIFLRLLEYYRGIMFLTTNRVAAFDDAILSRVTLVMSYPALDDTQRRFIWKRLLERAGLDDTTCNAFLHYNLNGRQIRNVIHLAQLLAQGQNQQFSLTHVFQALDAVTAGTNELLNECSLLQL